MRVIRRLGALRHMVTLSVLAVALSSFAATSGKVGAQAQAKDVFDDPVINSMTWEPADTEDTDGTSSDRMGDDCCPENCTQKNCENNCTDVEPLPVPEPV